MKLWQFLRGYREDFRELNRLAWPIIISRLGIVVIFLADFIMVGQYAAEHIAYLGLGLTPATVFVPLIIGLMMGTLVLVTQAYGAKRYKSCGAIWRQSLPYAFWIGVGGLVFCALGEPMLLLFGQTPELAREAGRVSLVTGLGLPFLTIGMTNGFFLEGLGRVRPGMYAMLAANVFNICLNALLIYGLWGFPEMGALGAAIATALSRVTTTMGIMLYIWFMPDHARFGVRERVARDKALSVRHRRIGYAGGISLGVEHIAFAGLTIFAGWLSTQVVAAHSIAMNFFGVCFMFGLGVGTATAVRVGHAYGAQNKAGMVRAVWFGLAVQMILMLATTLAIRIFDVEVAGFYTRDALVLPLAASLLAYVSFVLVLDTGQVLLTQALRVSNDIWAPSIIHTIAHLGISLPMAWVFAFPLGHGAYGLVEGFLCGAACSFVAAVGRFGWRMRRLDFSRLSFAPAGGQ